MVPVDVIRDYWRGRRRGVDLRAGLGQAGQRQVGAIAGAVLYRGVVEVDRRTARAAVFCPVATV